MLDVLAASAMVPGGIDVASLERAFGDELILRALTTALDLGLILGGATTVIFAHDVVREDVLNATEPRLGALAEQLSLDPTGIAPVAAAHIAARAGERQKAATLWREAANDANRALAPDDAVAHFERALEFESDPAMRAELFNALGLTCWQVGQFRRATDAHARAVELAEETRLAIPLAVGALGIAGPLGFQGVTVDQDVVSKLRAAIGLLVDEDGLTHRALTHAALAQALTFAAPGERGDIARLAVEAETIARKKLKDDGRDAWALIEVLSRIGWAIWDPADGLARRARANELVALADATQDESVVPMHRVEARIQRIANAVEHGEIAQAVDDIAECEVLADQTRLPYYKAIVVAMRGMIELLDGPAAEYPYTWEALEIGQRDQNQAIIQLFGAQLLYIRLLQGRTAELQAASESLAGYYTAIAGWRAGQALILALDGRSDEAATYIEELIRDDFAAVGRDMFYLVCLDHIARTAVLVADQLEPGALDLIYRQLSPFSGRNVVAGAAVAIHGPADVALALLAARRGDVALALRHLVAAQELARTTRCRPALVEIGALDLALRGGDDPATLEDDFDYIVALAVEIAELGLVAAARQLAEAITMVKARITTAGPAAVEDARLRHASVLLAPLLAQITVARPSWPRRALGEWLVTTVMPKLGPLLGRWDDETLDQQFRRRHVKIMRTMAALYRPDRGLGFSGQIGFRFLLEHGHPLEWHIEIDGRRAVAVQGPPADPAAFVITPVRPFAELMVGRLNGVQAWVEGRLDVKGDPTLAARLVEMFAGEQALVALAD
jgi:tetratricopeptide (TPR) repeat protein/putative sterol carrier protein